MKIEEYEMYVRDSMSSKYDKKLAIIGLVGEVGEVADVVKKEAIYDDMSKFEAKYGMPVKDKVIDELGDVLYQYVVVAAQYGISIEDIINYNVEKLNKRHGGAGKTASDGGGVR